MSQPLSEDPRDQLKSLFKEVAELRKEMVRAGRILSMDLATARHRADTAELKAQLAENKLELLTENVKVTLKFLEGLQEPVVGLMPDVLAHVEKEHQRLTNAL